MVCGSSDCVSNPDKWSDAAGSAPAGIGLTHAYASLEAIQHLLGRGSGLDLAAANAYAVGVTLFHLATGELPAHVDVGRRDSPEGMAMWETCLLQKVRASGAAHSQSSLLCPLPCHATPRHCPCAGSLSRSAGVSALQPLCTGQRYAFKHRRSPSEPHALQGSVP